MAYSYLCLLVTSKYNNSDTHYKIFNIMPLQSHQGKADSDHSIYFTALYTKTATHYDN